MAEIAPFRGLRYNVDKIPDLSKVVIPPYDVISPADQERYHNTSPFNMIRLELGKSLPEDTPDDNPHTRAARALRDWQTQGILIRDERPAIYAYELDYSLPSGRRLTRRGFVCALRLEEFSTGTVKPHEKTFPAVKKERLGLMTASQANLSPVFALYADPAGAVDGALSAGREQGPLYSFADTAGMEHRLWRVQDEEALREAARLMSSKDLFIADGHHRYETALNYRNMRRQGAGRDDPHASYNYIMVYLSNLNGDGLTILPTHRLLRHLGDWGAEAFWERASAFFGMSRFEANNEGRKRWQAALEAGEARGETVIGVCSRDLDVFILLKARREAVSAFLKRLEIPPALLGLDVVVLDEILLRHLLGLSEGFLADSSNIHFSHDFSQAVDKVLTEQYSLGFFINSTRIEQVQDVASAGLIMPHKSTYFYPKVGSGLVIHTMASGEGVVW